MIYFSMEILLEMSVMMMNCFMCVSGICSDRFFVTRYEYVIADFVKSVVDWNFMFLFLKCVVFIVKFVNIVVKSVVL